MGFSMPNSQSAQIQLVQLREMIDQVDKQLLDLLTHRSDCVEKIAAIKCQHKLPIYDGVRENRIIEKMTQDNPTRYQSVDLANIFHSILRAGLNQQLLYRAEHEE